jgi:WD40 repeat protein
MQGHTDWVWGVVHLPDGRRIITCSADSSLRLWDLESGIQIGDNWEDEEDEDEARFLTLALSPNGTTVASGSSDGTVRLWDVNTGNVRAKWTGHTDIVWQVCWSPDGERVVSRCSDGMVRMWDVGSSKAVLHPIKTWTRASAVAYSPDGGSIAIGGEMDEYGVKIWDSKTGDLLFTVEHDLSDSSLGLTSDSQSSLQWILSVCSLAWTSDGKKLISGSSDGSIRIHIGVSNI